MLVIAGGGNPRFGSRRRQKLSEPKSDAMVCHRICLLPALGELILQSTPQLERQKSSAPRLLPAVQHPQFISPCCLLELIIAPQTYIMKQRVAAVAQPCRANGSFNSLEISLCTLVSSVTYMELSKTAEFYILEFVMNSNTNTYLSTETRGWCRDSVFAS